MFLLTQGNLLPDRQDNISEAIDFTQQIFVGKPVDLKHERHVRPNGAELQERRLRRWIGSTMATLLKVGSEVVSPSSTNTEDHQLIVNA